MTNWFVDFWNVDYQRSDSSRQELDERRVREGLITYWLLELSQRYASILYIGRRRDIVFSSIMAFMESSHYSLICRLKMIFFSLSCMILIFNIYPKYTKDNIHIIP